MNKKEECRWKLDNKKTMVSKNHAFVRGLDPKYEVCRVCGFVRIGSASQSSQQTVSHQ